MLLSDVTPPACATALGRWHCRNDHYSAIELVACELQYAKQEGYDLENLEKRPCLRLWYPRGYGDLSHSGRKCELRVTLEQEDAPPVKHATRSSMRYAALWSSGMLR